MNFLTAFINAFENAFKNGKLFPKGLFYLKNKIKLYLLFRK
jgi:hypothetical protein